MNRKIIFILYFLFFLISTAYGDTYPFTDRLSDNIWLEIDEKEDRIFYYLKKYWNKYLMDDALKDAIRDGSKKLEQNTGYIKKLISPFHPGISIDFTEDIIGNALEDPLFKERLSYVIKDAVRDFITNDIITSDKVKSMLLEHFVKFYRAEINVDIPPNFNIVPIVKNTIVKGMVAKQGEVSLFALGIVEILTQKISLIIVNKIAGSLFFRLLPQVVKGIVPKAIPLVGVIFFTWDLLHPNTSIRKLRDTLLEKRSIENISFMVQKQLAYFIAENLKAHTPDIANVVYKASKEYVKESLESKIFGKGVNK